MSFACRPFVLCGTSAPGSSKQSQMRVRVQSRNMRAFAAYTGLACARAKAHFDSNFRGATASSSLLFSAASATSSTNYTIASPQGLGSLTKHVWPTKHVLHHMRTHCLHTAHSMPLQKVKKSSLPLCRAGLSCGSTTMSSDGACRSARLRVGAWQAFGTCTRPKRWQNVTIVWHCRLPLKALQHGHFHRCTWINAL